VGEEISRSLRVNSCFWRECFRSSSNSTP